MGQALSHSTVRSYSTDKTADHTLVQLTVTHSNSTKSVPDTAAPQDKLQTPSGKVRFFVMIDAGHGGDDAGARFTDKLFEKEVTLSVARKLRAELQNRGVEAVLLRDNDATLSYDQRAVATNGQRAGLYIGIHAGIPGSGVRVYTTMLPAGPTVPGPQHGEKRKNSPFIAWDTAQSGFLDRSQLVAVSLATELTNARITTTNASAPLLPLNNIAAPAVAVEIAPPQSSDKPDSLNNPKYQQAIAVAIAVAIAEARVKMEVHP